MQELLFWPSLQVKRSDLWSFHILLHIEYLWNETCSHKMRDSCKISFPSYNHIHVVQTLSFKMIYYMSWLLPYLGSKTCYFLEKFLCFLLIFEMFSEPYLLLFNGDLSLILWEQFSNTIYHQSLQSWVFYFCKEKIKKKSRIVAFCFKAYKLLISTQNIFHTLENVSLCYKIVLLYNWLQKLAYVDSDISYKLHHLK